MPNWCECSYVLVSSEKVIDKIENVLDKYKLACTYDNKWVGDILKDFYPDINLEKIYCRAWLCDYDRLSKSELKLIIESAWCRPTEIEDYIKEHKTEDIDFYYWEYEPGCAIFATNDIDGRYFTDTVAISADSIGAQTCDEEQALEIIKEYHNKNFRSLETAINYCMKFNKMKARAKDDQFIYVSEILYTT